MWWILILGAVVAVLGANEWRSWKKPGRAGLEHLHDDNLGKAGRAETGGSDA